ncbi:LysM peptidoglycan-binding domain-containing protein [Myceligenerans crystallogenes]
MGTTATAEVRRVRHLYVVPPPEQAPPRPGRPATARRPVAPRRPAAARSSVAARFDLDGLRLTTRGRVVVALAAFALAAPLVWGATAAANPPLPPQELRAHAVAPGESLWALAASVAEPGQDVRDVVRELQDLNGLATASLQVGQTVYLPEG